MTTPEGRVKARVKQVLKEHKVWFFMPVSNGYGTHGIPDFCCVHDGRAFFIETKAGNKQPTPRQQATMKSITAAGGVTFLINEETGLKELEEWLTTP